jgi:hypothetical protein
MSSAVMAFGARKLSLEPGFERQHEKRFCGTARCASARGPGIVFSIAQSAAIRARTAPVTPNCLDFSIGCGAGLQK